MNEPVKMIATTNKIMVALFWPKVFANQGTNSTPINYNDCPTVLKVDANTSKPKVSLEFNRTNFSLPNNP